LLGPLTLALALTPTRMGNTSSVTGPVGGRPHVIRDESDAGSVRGQRPEHSQIETTDARLAEDYSDEEVDGRRDRLRVPESRESYRKSTIFHPFLPNDAMQSAVIPQYVVWHSVCPSVCDVQVCFSHRLENIENNFTADSLRHLLRSVPTWAMWLTGTPQN